MKLPKETEAKLLEDMIAAYESRREEHRGGPESAMRIALYVAVPVIRDAVLDEAAVEIEDATGSEIGRSYAAIIRAMKTEGGE